MRTINKSYLGLLAVLLPSALHAQALGRMGRPTGPSMPAPQSSQAGSRPSYPVQSYSAQSYPQFTPRQTMPLRGAPIYAQPSQPDGRSFGTQMPSRGPVFSVPAYPVQSSRPTAPSGQSFPGGIYQNNGNAPVFNGLNGIRGYRALRVTTPTGPANLPRSDSYPPYGGAPTYNNGGGYYGGGYGTGVTVVGGPSLLGGFYYGNYCDSYSVNTFPSIYSAYSGFPSYIYSPASVIVLADPYAPAYVTGYQPFYTPSYPVVYNENIYYVGSQERAQQIVGDDDTARRAALRTAYPEGSYQAAFGDIERAWLDGNVSGLQKHLRGNDVKLSVFFKGKYSYSIATTDYVQITRDAFDKLSTVSFKFDRLRKAKNGDVTAFGTHVYRGASGSETAGSEGTVPFDTDKSDVTYDNTTNAAPGVEKTTHVAYTLRHQGGQWNIVAIDSSPAASTP